MVWQIACWLVPKKGSEGRRGGDGDGGGGDGDGEGGDGEYNLAIIQQSTFGVLEISLKFEWWEGLHAHHFYNASIEKKGFLALFTRKKHTSINLR